MTMALIGGVVGAVLGFANFAVLQNVAKKLDLKAEGETNSRGAKVVRIAAWVDIVIFPLVGYYVGTMLS